MIEINCKSLNFQFLMARAERLIVTAVCRTDSPAANDGIEDGKKADCKIIRGSPVQVERSLLDNVSLQDAQANHPPGP